jgi:sugar/nucleoside kinase (ribokinase family)
MVQAGDEGDLLLARDQAVRLPRLPVSMVDPTGGGDALVASLVVLLAQGAKLAPAGRLAAAHTVSHLGRRPTYADRGELAAMYDRETDS